MSSVWPTRTIELDAFPGWRFTMDDLSVSEVAELEEALAGGKFKEISVKLFPAIREWNFTDRAGNVLPLELDSLDLLPMNVVKILLSEMLSVVNEPALPKETTE